MSLRVKNTTCRWFTRGELRGGTFARLIDSGVSFAKIASDEGISPERVCQLVQDYRSRLAVKREIEDWSGHVEDRPTSHFEIPCYVVGVFQEYAPASMRDTPRGWREALRTPHVNRVVSRNKSVRRWVEQAFGIRVSVLSYDEMVTAAKSTGRL